MESLQTLIIGAIPLLFAISLHEAAHGGIAHLLGDPTAKMLGRLTANPLKHIDPVGTVLVPIIMVLIIGVPFGWAKPVPVDVRNFKDPLKDMALVAIAGPVSNLLMAIFWAICLLIFVPMADKGDIFMLVANMASFGVFVNIILMVLNLFPVPPLDGGRVVTGVLPREMAYAYSRIEPFGMWIVIFLFATGILGKILLPVVEAIQLTLYSILGLA